MLLPDSCWILSIEDGQKELNERRAQAARREYTLRLTPKDLLKELETLDEMRAKVMERELPSLNAWQANIADERLLQASSLKSEQSQRCVKTR